MSVDGLRSRMASLSEARLLSVVRPSRCLEPDSQREGGQHVAPWYVGLSALQSSESSSPFELVARR